MADRSDREKRYDIETRVRLLEDDMDANDGRGDRRDIAVTRLTQAAFGLLITLVSGMAIYLLTMPR